MKLKPKIFGLIGLATIVVGLTVRALWIAESEPPMFVVSLSVPLTIADEVVSNAAPVPGTANIGTANNAFAPTPPASKSPTSSKPPTSSESRTSSESPKPSESPNSSDSQAWESKVVDSNTSGNHQFGTQPPAELSRLGPASEAVAGATSAPLETFALPTFQSKTNMANRSESVVGSSGFTISPNLSPGDQASTTETATASVNIPSELDLQSVELAEDFTPLPGMSNITATSATEPAASNAAVASVTNATHPSVLASAESFVLAAQPKLGDHWMDDRPQIDRCATLTETITEDFSPDAVNEYLPYDPYHQMHIYEGKTLNANQRPLLELGRPWYQLGQLSPGSNILGKHNPLTTQFLIYGDFRSAIASNTQQGNNVTRSAVELNLDFDLKLTDTERFHMFMSPLDDGKTNTGYLFDDDESIEKFDANIDFGYFEGDLGAIVGGLTNKTLPFDFPFAIGVMPLLMQNGIWMEDAFLGVAATVPARNSARFNISNMDTTFFAGYDKINSPAFANDDSAARMYGIASFIEALNGYLEIDYAFLDDRNFDNRSYHNMGIGYTRRYGRFVSNSTRMIVNAGQSTDAVENTADGVLLLSENSLITGAPSTVVPYFNLFAGFDRPQSAARAVQAGGILRNTGILFESDGMTNYPTLDPTANDTFGGALGLNLLPDLSQQLVVETAWLNVMGEEVNRNAAGNQYGVGVRYQLPLTNALIFRADGMVAFLDDASDLHGVRLELRHKW